MAESVSAASDRALTVVVGGGIGGLAAAHFLARDSGREVLLLEGSPIVGGKLRLASVAGVVVDVGAEAMLNRRPEGVALARELGLPVVHPATASSRLWSGGSLKPLPRSLMGVPMDLDDLAASGVLSAEGLARAAAEPTLPPTELEGDVSVAALVGERLGEEVVDRLVEPLLGGVYAGRARELSARATTPQLVAMLDRGSLVEAAAAAVPSGGDPVFAGIPGGMGMLPAVLAAHGGFTVRTGATVREVRRTETGFELVVGSTRDAELVRATDVVLATPSAPTARLLADLAPAAAAELAAVETASVAIVTLAFRASEVPEVARGRLVGVPGPTRGGSADQGGHLLVRQVGVGTPRRTRCARRGRPRRAAHLAGPAPRGGVAAGHRRGAGGGLARRPRCGHRPRRHPGRHARPAVGRRAAAVRRRTSRPGRPDPRRRRPRAGARRLWRGLRRGGDPGRDRLGPARRRRGVGGRMTS